MRKLQDEGVGTGRFCRLHRFLSGRHIDDVAETIDRQFELRDILQQLGRTGAPTLTPDPLRVREFPATDGLSQNLCHAWTNDSG
jgi:hypothetical protein